MLKVGFVCIHNSCRSQIAEAWGNKILSGIAEVYSAGTEEYPEIKPLALEVMKEVGIEMITYFPKTLEKIPHQLDILITMGCGVECPFVPSRLREDWGLVDPSGGTIDDFRETRDVIQEKMEMLRDRILNDELLKHTEVKNDEEK